MDSIHLPKIKQSSSQIGLNSYNSNKKRAAGFQLRGILSQANIGSKSLHTARQNPSVRGLQDCKIKPVLKIQNYNSLLNVSRDAAMLQSNSVKNGKDNVNYNSMFRYRNGKDKATINVDSKLDEKEESVGLN